MNPPTLGFTPYASTADEQQYRELVEAAGDIIFRTDSRGRFTYLNPAGVRTLGYNIEQLLRRPYLDIVAPAHRETLAAILRLQFLDRTPQTYVEFETLTASGARIWIGQTVVLLTDGDAIVGFQAVARDISARVQLERQQRAQYEIALLIGTGGTDIDHVGREILRTLCERTDWDHGQLWLSDEHAVFHLGPFWQRDECPSIESPTKLPFEEALLGSSQQRNDALWVSDLGAEPKIDGLSAAHAAGLRSAIAFPIVLNNEVSGVVCLFSRAARERDNDMLHLAATVGTHIGQFFERCRTEHELSEARDAALESSRMKSEFLATISHEIRTPMNAIIGSSELLAETRLNDEQQKLGATIQSAASALLRIIDDILDFSKIESGRLSIENTDFDLLSLIASVTEPIAARAAAKNLTFDLRIAPQLDGHVFSDPRRLRQILASLLDNAIKFTERGSVRVRIDPTPDELVRFTITDTGIGLSESDRSRLFQPFTQADGSITRKYGGTGLGLTISRRLAELLGGEMEVASREGEGSTFWFTIRLPRSKRDIIPSSDSNRSAWRILVAEDNLVNQQLIVRQLATLGIACDVVADGQQAFASVTNGHYDLVLMDLQMPLLDGFSATRLIRQWEVQHTTRPIPIVAITANGTTADRARCLDIGMNEHLPKPLRLGDLSEVLERLLANPVAPATLPVLLDAATIDELRALGDDDPSFFRELVDQYRTDAETRLVSLEEAAEKRDRSAIHKLAHALRGSSANLGAIEVAQACNAIEAMAETDDADGYAVSVRSIREAYERVLPLLETLATPA